MNWKNILYSLSLRCPTFHVTNPTFFFNNIDIAINLAEKCLLQMATDVIILLEILKI